MATQTPIGQIKPMRVALASIGKSLTADRFLDMMGRMGLGDALVFDLDKCMCSPEESMKIAHLSGQNFTAQREVFSHANFCNVVLSIIQAIQSDVVGRHRVYFAADRHGTFSDVVLRSVEQVLNVLLCEQTDPQIDQSVPSIATIGH